jgi:hypothetical protein
MISSMIVGETGGSPWAAAEGASPALVPSIARAKAKALTTVLPWAMWRAVSDAAR